MSQRFNNVITTYLFSNHMFRRIQKIQNVIEVSDGTEEGRTKKRTKWIKLEFSALAIDVILYYPLFLFLYSPYYL